MLRPTLPLRLHTMATLMSTARLDEDEEGDFCAQF
jgi:hypothetical protein